MIRSPEPGGSGWQAGVRASVPSTKAAQNDVITSRMMHPSDRVAPNPEFTANFTNDPKSGSIQGECVILAQPAMR